MYRTLAAVVLLIAVHERAQAQMQVIADFPGGSARVISLDAAEQRVHISPVVQPDRGWPCWWYCRLDDLTVGRPVDVTVSANSEPFRDKWVLDSKWMLPDRAAISVDNVNWKHTDKGELAAKSATYRFEASAKTMWIAWGPPFLPSHAERLLKQIAKQLPDADVFELARTRAGRSVHAIRLGDRSSEQSRHSAVWIQARQHAWEAGSSWVAQGFLKWIASDDPIAAELRGKSTIVVVPIMDVDRVSDGAGGKASVPRDHNRDWDAKPIYPEVAAAQAEILRLHKSHRFDVFVDLHNPGPDDRKPFFFGPKIDELPELQHRNFIRWKAIASSLIDDLEPEYRFAAYVKTQEERDRVSSNWVRNHTSPHVVAMTLETAWNRPKGTQQGYQQVGRQLGLTIARYLSNDPSKK